MKYFIAFMSSLSLQIMCGIQLQKSADSGANWLDIIGANNLIYTVSNATASSNYRAIYTCSGLGCCN